MDTSDIINSILAGLTFIGIIVALGLGIWSIREMRNTQKLQYRESVLDNILGWLDGIEDCETQFNPTSILDFEQSTATPARAKRYQALITGHLVNEYITLTNKGEAILKLFSNKDAALPRKVVRMIELLNSLYGVHNKYRVAFLDFKGNDSKGILDLMSKQRAEANGLIDNVMNISESILNETTKLKYVKSIL